MLLREKEPKFLTIPLVVACYNCQMTMWANSDNAHLDSNERIICSGCLIEP